MGNETEVIITFQPDGKRVKVTKDSTVLSAAVKAGIDLTSICSGKGTCGKCKVIIEESNKVNILSEKEKEHLNAEEIDKKIRLACYTKVQGDIIVKIPEISRTGKQRLQIEGIDTPVELNSSVKKYYIEPELPTLEDPRSDADRITDTLKEKFNLSNVKISYQLLKELGEKVRLEEEWKFTVVAWDDEIIDIEPGDTTDRIFGYAVDIGTTKLAGYLLDLNTGKVIAAGSLMNPQIPYGEDVISRLNHPDQSKLQNAVIEGLNEILKDLNEKTGIKYEEIYEMTAVGNTVMHHIFLGINPLYLGRSPYPPVIRNTMILHAYEIGININKCGKIVFLPTIAGFVGADTISVILSTEIYKKDEISLAIDIGTNTEVVLGNKDKLLAASCASGPAFEGAHIKFGMRASSGAIEKIKINSNSLKAEYETIDNAPPIGICGSGMIDLVSEMIKNGIIDVGGIISQKISNPLLRMNSESSMEYIVVNASESGNNEDITFSQKDVIQIILAKAAMFTGIKLLLKNSQLDKEDIKKIYLAGAFGSHINKESAQIIGIFPEVDLEKVEVVGNAAGTGARMCLTSGQSKVNAEDISKFVNYLELGVDPDFQGTFLNSHIIPYADLDEFPETSQLLKDLGHYPETPPPKF